MPENTFSLQPSFQEKQYRLRDIMPLFKEKLAAGKTVTFFPKGTSMMPMIRQGVDKVVLSPLPKKLKTTPKTKLPQKAKSIRKNDSQRNNRKIRACGN